MTWATVAIAGASLVGGVIASSGAKSAANTQAEAANNATAAQQGMFDKTVGLEAPFRQSGLDAQTKLNGLLGIGNGSSGAGNGGGSQTGGAFDPSTFNEQSYLAANSDVANYIQQHPGMTALQHYQQFGQNEGRQLAPAAPGAVESDTNIWRRLAGQYTDANGNVNSDTLNPAVWAESARQKQAAAAQASQPAGPNDFTGNGSLLKPFSMADFQEDPGIQFQTQQGNLALTNSNAAQNGSLSGAALKSLIGYNQGMAGTGYQSAFDRYMAGKSFNYGALKDMVNIGQAAAGNTVNAAPSFSSGIASTIQGAGNASAAGTVGSANALASGLTGAGNSYLLRNLISQNGGGGSAAPSFGAGIITDGPTPSNVG